MRVGQALSVDGRPERLRLRLDPEEGRVGCVVRGAVAGQIEGDQPEASAERTVELFCKSPRGGGIAVQEHGRRSLPRRLVRRDPSVWGVEQVRLRGPVLPSVTREA